MCSMGYNRANIIMSNGIRILEGLKSSRSYECKDYPVWDNDNWNDRWSSDSWQDSHGN